MLRTTDTILGPPRVSEAILGGIIARLDQPDQKDRDFLNRLIHWCAVAGVDDGNAVSQWLWETSNGTSTRWNNDLNPSGIGITSDATIQPFVIDTADEAARLFVQCLYSMVRKEWHPDVPIPDDARSWMDRVWLAKVRNPAYPNGVSQVQDENLIYYTPDGDWHATWAADANYMQHVQRGNTFMPALPDQGTPPQETPQMAKPTIILVAGHRSDGDSGNPNEKQRTPYLANAYYAAFRAADYATHYVQNEDGDGRPDITSGGLDTVSQKTRQVMQGISGPMVLLDLHFEGADARGVFAIVPDEAGLVTAIAGGTPGNDTWANNPLDVQLAGVISRKISAATGLPLRQTTQPGIMSERHTGVGYQGYRLATMAYSAWCRDRAVRLVVEHGSLPTADVNIINQPGFYEKCAAAAVAAVNEVYGVGTTPQPKPEPEPEPEEPTMPKLPKGLTIQMVRRLYNPLGAKDPDTGKRAAFSEDDEAAVAWLRHSIKVIPKGGDWTAAMANGGFGPLLSIIRRGDGSRLHNFVGFAHEVAPEQDAA